MARKRNARRVILEDLRSVSRWMRWATSYFDQSGKVFERTAPMSYADHWRKRRPEEYIENDPVLLRRFARGALEASEALAAVASYALRRAREVERGE